MSVRSDVSPSTLPVEVTEEAVVVEYLDGRRVAYRDEPEPKAGRVKCQPGKHVHILVTDPSTAEGVMVYVNDRKTHDEILEATGVGRIVLDVDESAEVFPGVTARMDGHAVVVDADLAVAGGRVFVFEEDDLGERAFEIVETDTGEE